MRILFLIAAVVLVTDVTTYDTHGHETHYNPTFARQQQPRGFQYPAEELSRVQRTYNGGGIGSHLGGNGCPVAEQWFNSHDDDEDDGHYGQLIGSPRTLSRGDAIHLAIKIRALKKKIKVLCNLHQTTQKPHMSSHKPRPPSHNRPQSPYPNIASIIPEDAYKTLQNRMAIRRHVIRPLRRFFGWPVGTLASAILLR